MAWRVKAQEGLVEIGSDLVGLHVTGLFLSEPFVISKYWPSTVCKALNVKASNTETGNLVPIKFVFGLFVLFPNKTMVNRH